MKQYISGTDLDILVCQLISQGSSPLEIFKNIDIEELQNLQLKIMARTLLHTDAAIKEHATFFAYTAKLLLEGENNE